VRRNDPAPVFVRNAGLVARREYGVRVRSRAFAVSTLVLAVVAAVAALAPLAIRALERESVVRIAASAPDERAAELTRRSLELVLNAGASIDPTGSPPYDIQLVDPAAVEAARAQVAAGTLNGLLSWSTAPPTGSTSSSSPRARPAARPSSSSWSPSPSPPASGPTRRRA
jgi:hypothetical protein